MSQGAPSGPSAARKAPGRTTVLAIVADAATAALFPKLITDDRLFVTADLAEGLTLASAEGPEVAFVEIGINGGAGLAMVHHLKAVVPGITIYALSSRSALEAAANAVALGGAGLLMMPIGGDEVLSALATVRLRLAERAMRAELEQAAQTYARVAGWLGRVAELADGRNRTTAAEQLVEVLTEATGAPGAAVYLGASDKPAELTRAAVSPSLEHLPAFGMESEIVEQARRERLLVVPLATRTLRVGHVLLAEPRASSASGAAQGPAILGAEGRPHAGPPSHALGASPASRLGSNGPRGPSSLRTGVGRFDGLVKLLATQAAASFALLGERERVGGALVKDPASSAYAFGYYADVAGREIDRARRYKRRFAIATVAFDPPGPGGTSAPEMADLLLRAARDTDILARVDEHEFHLLMPETDGLGAQGSRRRVQSRLTEKNGRDLPKGLTVGVATFPHDGQDLSQLLRVARRRGEASRGSVVHGLAPEPPRLLDLLDQWMARTEPWPIEDIAAPRAIEISLPDAVALASTVVTDGIRGGATLIVVAHHPRLTLGPAVRAALGAGRENATLHAVDVRGSQGEELEALAVIAEHGAYAFLGRSRGGVIKGLHAADVLLAELLAERLSRAAGIRIFS
ncbi:MAG: diguanylate cyclase [Byssovorax sp.]